jgi:coenzyme F420 hydrogenase subunit beta
VNAGVFSIRDDMNGIAEAPGKTWFFELAAAVIDADRCVQCGACIAACPTDSIGVGHDDLPQLVKMCTGCSLCWDFCPRGGLRYESTWLSDPFVRPDGSWRITGSDPAPGLGRVLGQSAAKVRDESRWYSQRAQDGGVVSVILAAALEAGEIDGALVAREDPEAPWKGIAHLATTVEEILASAGSFYNQTMALAHLDLDKLGLGPATRIAIVGTPCEIQGLRAMQTRAWRRGRSRPDAIVLSIALLCTKSFDYRKLMLRDIRDEREIDLAGVGKVDVIHGRLIVEDHDGAPLLDEPVKNFHDAALKGCDECADFLGRAADVSVGSVGSAQGWSSVLVRTPAGERALARLAPELEVRDLDAPEALVKLDQLDKKTAARTLQRELDPEGPLFIDYEEHALWYGGTDRAPVWKEG